MKTPDFPMPITTDRLIIRPIQKNDEAILNQAILESFDELHHYLEWASKIPSRIETSKYVKQAADNWITKKNNEPYLQLIILDKDTYEFIGDTSFHHYNWKIPSIETGYWICTSKLGYTLEGRLKNHRIKPSNGQVGDTVIYARYDLDSLPKLVVTWG